MGLSETERAFGMRSFAVRGGSREIVHEPGAGWWLYISGADGRTRERRPLLSFADVEAELSGQPNMLSDARAIEESIK